MTTIAAKIIDDTIYIGADSRVSFGYEYTKVDQTMESSKICEGSDMVIAGTGTLSECSLIQLYAKDHSIGCGGQLRVLEWLLEFSKWKKSKVDDYSINNSYIIAHKSGLYKTWGTSVELMKNFTALGSGGSYAFTALHLGKSLREALEVSCELDPYTEGPIVIKTMELKSAKAD